MRISELQEFDPSAYLKDEETIRLYLAEAFEEMDPRLIQAAIGDAVKAKGLASVAHASGIAPDQLQHELSHEGNATFATVIKVLHALGLRMTIATITRHEATAE